MSPDDEMREQLDLLTSSLVAAIRQRLEYRRANGSFDTLEELVEQLLAAAPAPPPASPEPVAWRYELASAAYSPERRSRYTEWRWHLTEYKPHVPEGSIRNLTPLYATAPAPPEAEDEGIKRQCAHYGGIPARCLIAERNWSPGVVPQRCTLCPDSAPPEAGEERDNG